MKALIVGAGGAGRIHLEQMDERGIETRVFDIDLDKAAALSGGRVEVDPLAEDYDVAIVAVPAHQHRAVVEAQAPVREFVICEKPLALYPEDAAAIAELDKVLIAESQCYAGADGLGVQRMAASMQRGDIGRPIIWRLAAQTSYRPQSWCSDLHVGGGAFIEGGVHVLTTARVVFGEAVGWQGSVRCFGGGTGPDSGTIIVDYEHGDQCVLSMYWGTEGAFAGGETVNAPATLVTPRVTKTWWPPDAHAVMWDHLLKVIAGEVEPVATTAQAAGAVADVWRCYEAAGVAR